MHRKAHSSHYLGYRTSLDVKLSGRKEYAGSVTVQIDGVDYQFSTSGLTADQDTVVSLVLISHKLRLPYEMICKNIL